MARLVFGDNTKVGDLERLHVAQLCALQAATRRCKTSVSRALSGFAGGFESRLWGIIGVCLTVAVTYAVATCGVGGGETKKGLADRCGR